jgi:hypothetical protein
LIASSFGQQILLLNGQLKTYSKALGVGILISSVLAYLVGGSSLYAIAISMCIGKCITMLIVLTAARKSLVEFPLSIVFKTMLPGLTMFLVLYVSNLDSFAGNISVGAFVFLVSGYFWNRKEFNYVFEHAYKWFLQKH